MNRPLSFSHKAMIDILLLHQIVSICDSMYMGQVYKAAYLLAFFTFLRIYNMVPHSLALFDPSHHLARGDLIPTKSAFKVII